MIDNELNRDDLGRIIAIILLFSLIIPISAISILYRMALRDSSAFIDIPSTESPYPFLDLNETLVHIMVEGNMDDHGVLGAEERAARYHNLFGYQTSVRYQVNASPDDSGITPETSNVTHIGGLGDGAFLTGLALFGQSFRWATYNRENNQDGILAAEKQIGRMLEGLYILTHVTGTPGELARYAIPMDANIGYPTINQDHYFQGRICPSYTSYNPDYIESKHNYPETNWSGWMYKDDTSRDQNLGALMGLAGVIAYCTNTTLYSLAGEILLEIVDFLYESNWFVNSLNYTGIDRFTNGADFNTGMFCSGWGKLSLLQVARQINSEKYDPIYKSYLTVYGSLLKLEGENIRMYIIGDYFPMNLGWLTVWMVVNFMPKNDPMFSYLIDIVKDGHYAAIKNNRNAWFQCLYLNILKEDDLSSEENTEKYGQIIVEIRDSLQRMSRMRLKHFNNLWELPFAEDGLDINPNDEDQLETLYDTNADKWNDKLGFFIDLTDTLGASIFGRHLKYALPIDYRDHYDFPWQFNPFKFDNLKPRNDIEYFHTELTIVYWMARYMNIVGCPETDFSPRIFSQSEIEQSFPYFTLSTDYSTTNSVMEAYGL